MVENDVSMNSGRSLKSLDVNERRSNLSGQKVLDSDVVSSVTGSYSQCPKIYEEII